MCRHREASGQDAGHAHVQIISGNRPPASRWFDVVPARISHSSRGSILGCEPGPLRIKNPSPLLSPQKKLGAQEQGPGLAGTRLGSAAELVLSLLGVAGCIQEQVETRCGLPSYRVEVCRCELMLFLVCVCVCACVRMRVCICAAVPEFVYVHVPTRTTCYTNKHQQVGLGTVDRQDG